MWKLFLLGLGFWLLTLLFPAIDISGFWTIAGVIVLFGIFNLVYHLTLGIVLLPFRVLTFDFVSWLANVGILYILAAIFTNFTVGGFFGVLLFAGLFTLVKGLVIGTNK